jgi:hypothetical protein
MTKGASMAMDVLQRGVVTASGYQSSHYYLGLTLARLGRKEDSERELALTTKLADEESKKLRSGLHLLAPAEKP